MSGAPAATRCREKPYLAPGWVGAARILSQLRSCCGWNDVFVNVSSHWAAKAASAFLEETLAY